MPELNDILYWIVVFILGSFIQSLMINGLHYCFQGGCVQEMNKGKVCDGNIFYKMNPSFFEKNKGKWWSFPLFACVRCMSWWGSLVYWPLVLSLFGFQVWQIPIWIVNLFCLISLNYWIYKKL